MVEGDDYESCANVEMWSSKKKGNYGKGLSNSDEDSKRVERTGKLGEMAFAKACGLGVDLNYRKFGDDCDFLLMGLRIDVKTSMSNRGYGTIYAKAPGGRLIDLKCDRYVFAHIVVDDREKRHAIIDIVGYLKRSQLENEPLFPGWRGGGHHNFVFKYKELEPISKIIMATRKEVALL